MSSDKSSISYRVEGKDTQKRLDVYIAAKNTKYSRSIWQKLIDQGYVLVNGKKTGTKYILKVGDRVEIKPYQRNLALDIPVIYEDADVVVLDKPSGIITHLKSDLESEPSVASFIAAKIDFEKPTNRAGIVHRLDRDTSGIIITAKNEGARAYLARQFSERKTKKFYLAAVEGTIDKDMCIDSPIERSKKLPSTFTVGENGKSAKTDVHVLDSKNVVLLRPYTGRTHQLRVHLKSVGHPIIGDRVYAKSEDDRLQLHAWKLEITLPSRERRIFTSEVPEDMSKYINDEDVSRAEAVAASFFSAET